MFAQNAEKVIGKFLWFVIFWKTFEDADNLYTNFKPDGNMEVSWRNLGETMV